MQESALTFLVSRLHVIASTVWSGLVDTTLKSFSRRAVSVICFDHQARFRSYTCPSTVSTGCSITSRVANHLTWLRILNWNFVELHETHTQAIFERFELVDEEDVRIRSVGGDKILSHYPSVSFFCDQWSHIFTCNRNSCQVRTRCDSLHKVFITTDTHRFMFQSHLFCYLVCSHLVWVYKTHMTVDFLVAKTQEEKA